MADKRVVSSLKSKVGQMEHLAAVSNPNSCTGCTVVKLGSETKKTQGLKFNLVCHQSPLFSIEHGATIPE